MGTGETGLPFASSGVLRLLERRGSLLDCPPARRPLFTRRWGPQWPRLPQNSIPRRKAPTVVNRPGTINHTMYSTYLSEHLLGSEGGISAFKAASKTWKGTPAEHQFLSLVQQVADDHSDLEKIIRTLGYRPHPVKRVLTQGVRLAGRLNPVNVLRHQKAGMTQVELDILLGMLRAKKAMWETLLLVSARDGRLEVPLLEDLVRRADSQLQQVSYIIEQTWDTRFFHTS